MRGRNPQVVGGAVGRAVPDVPCGALDELDLPPGWTAAFEQDPSSAPPPDSGERTALQMLGYTMFTAEGT